MPGYLPTTTITNEPDFIVPRRSPGAGGSKSAAGRKMLWVLRSRAMVRDRKSTRLNSSHLVISYAVFCLKKKKNENSYIAVQVRVYYEQHDTRHRSLTQRVTTHS